MCRSSKSLFWRSATRRAYYGEHIIYRQACARELPNEIGRLFIEDWPTGWLAPREANGRARGRGMSRYIIFDSESLFGAALRAVACLAFDQEFCGLAVAWETWSDWLCDAQLRGNSGRLLLRPADASAPLVCSTCTRSVH